LTGLRLRNKLRTPPEEGFVTPSRRSLVFAGVSALALPIADSRAQSSRGGPPLVGALLTDRRELGQPILDGIVAQLARAGDLRGRDFSLESRFAERQVERLPSLARELVALRPAMIIAATNAATAAVLAETRSIPIVMFNSVSPVTMGFVGSLAHPGGSVTGTTYNPLEIGGKMVEALHAIAPRVKRVTVIWNPESQGGAMKLYKPFADRAAQRLNLAYTYIDLARAEDFSPADVLATRPEALYLPADSVVLSLMPQILRLASEQKWPTISVLRLAVELGALVALLPEQAEIEQNVADLVHQLLHGASAGNLPVREPTRFQLVLNMKTARAVGLAIPKDVLLQATEVLE
jgi:putative ABC transport system substrate-binding protein